jgi:hypothetical protein
MRQTNLSFKSRGEDKGGKENVGLYGFARLLINKDILSW